MKSTATLIEAIHAINSNSNTGKVLMRYVKHSTSSAETAILLMKLAISARNKNALICLDASYRGPLLMTTLFGSPNEEAHCTEEELQWVISLKYREAKNLYAELCMVDCYHDGANAWNKLRVVKRLAAYLPLSVTEWNEFKETFPKWLHEKVDKIIAQSAIVKSSEQKDSAKKGEIYEMMMKQMVALVDQAHKSDSGSVHFDQEYLAKLFERVLQPAEVNDSFTAAEVGEGETKQQDA